MINGCNFTQFTKCTNADFAGVNFTNFNLTNYPDPFSYTCAPGDCRLNWYSDFSGANFSGADLTNANLAGGDFTGANFTGANLTGAKVTCASFEGATLAGADFTAAQELPAQKDLIGQYFAELGAVCGNVYGRIIGTPKVMVPGYRLVDRVITK